MHQLFNDIDTIIWDYNGTLLNDIVLCVDSINELLHQRNLPLVSVDLYKELFDFPVKVYYEKIGFDFQKEDFLVVGQEFINRYNQNREKACLQANAKEVLACFARSGKSQLILSAREANSLKDELKHFGLDVFFNSIYGLSDNYAFGKTELGLTMIKELNLNSERTILIGDTLHDVEVADKMGVKSLLISHGHHKLSRLRESNKPLVNSLNELCC